MWHSYDREMNEDYGLGWSDPRDPNSTEGKRIQQEAAAAYIISQQSTLQRLQSDNVLLEQENRELKQFIVALLLIIAAFCTKYWGIL